MSIRRAVTLALQRGDLTGASPMLATPGIGIYLEARLRRAFDSRNVAGIFTVDAFWTSARQKSTQRLITLLQRALQNERANQCVSKRTVGHQSTDTYHVADINAFGYQACVALLDYQRRHTRVAYGPLPTHPPRSPSSKACGCKEADACQQDSKCAWNRADGQCVPRAHNARGFVGVLPHPDQGAYAHTDAERRSVKRRGYTRRSRSLRNDPASNRDMRNGHGRSLRYSRRGNRMWRAPARKVRLPIVR